MWKKETKGGETIKQTNIQQTKQNETENIKYKNKKAARNNNKPKY